MQMNRKKRSVVRLTGNLSSVFLHKKADFSPLLLIFLTFYVISCSTPLFSPGTSNAKSAPLSSTTASSQQNNGSALGWSTGYYVGWLQDGYPPQTIPWKAITVLNHSSLTTSDKRDGTITLAHHLTPTYMHAAVAAAHTHHVKILISIGGSDDYNFDAACNSTNRDKFINNLINIMKTYGYDGIDLDIEQDFGAPDHTDYIACVAGIQDALSVITPRPLLTEAADPDWQAPMLTQVWRYLDEINLMSYHTNYQTIGDKLNNYTSLGVPKNKLGIGLGLGDGNGVDTTVDNCRGKAEYAMDNGYGGIMEWIITDDQAAHHGKTPCFDAIAPYVS